MKSNKILILGGTGKTGRRVAEQLTQLGHTDLRIGSRNANPPFDWENPATWLDAIAGMDSVYITFQPDLAIPSSVDAIRNFTTLAAENGITKMVLLSGRGEKEAQACEQVVMNTALNWTIVRSSWFNQNFSESIFLEPVLAGYVALPRAEAQEPFTDADDIADVVVQALINDKHNGQVYELTGPRLLTFGQAVAEIANATGRKIQFEGLSLEDYTAMLRDYQVPEEIIWLVNYLFTEVLDGRNSSVTNDIEKVLGRKAKDFSVYAQETAKSGVWNMQMANK
ncbi:NmrA family transcriptional regulator [Solitalea longa]|uniref:NmrA family transcriptional regulator n=1 Tax=Solitalea longa TaxID=2079460 RepID=A0A2S5A2H7_9SPHI|nr:NAD(P)H-binding protein [Solitalea longa]POY36745.1 NmrA family transcriptional regulator [Solitalea longa]